MPSGPTSPTGNTLNLTMESFNNQTAHYIVICKIRPGAHSNSESK